MANRSGDIGTWTAERVVQYLREHGFPNAERTALHGCNDVGDITGTPGICWEVKGGHAAETASDAQVDKWLIETERERICARADVGVLVLKRRGIGAANAGRWWAVVLVDALAQQPDRRPVAVATRMHLADVCALLLWDGYGGSRDLTIRHIH